MKHKLTEIAKFLIVPGLVLLSLVALFSAKFSMMTIYFH